MNDHLAFFCMNVWVYYSVASKCKYQSLWNLETTFFATRTNDVCTVIKKINKFRLKMVNTKNSSMALKWCNGPEVPWPSKALSSAVLKLNTTCFLSGKLIKRHLVKKYKKHTQYILLIWIKIFSWFIGLKIYAIKLFFSQQLHCFGP